MEQSLEQKRDREKQIIETMIRMYCRGTHGGDTLCPECTELLNYCHARIDSCPRMATKTFCSACEHPCYKPEMRERVRIAMRYAGPRMLFVHPVMAVRHMMSAHK
ncbi:MAG: nitrous oxide-stimulated promoter family protein [Eggerthellaceae bacterium]|mgnify:CR=1 FL=1|jgi:predicted amidophosphoribosyltransferase|nr:nitrous oxide-stimulated promoter family protein [Eggerthellaceae bacterium]MCH4221459.1 nitrous oxide-stimulated promoter family protein [Eggerthellaceae bacterium]